MDAVIIIIVFMSFCTILSLGIGIASYLQYKQNLKYTPDLKYKSFLENAGNTVLSFIKNAASTLTPAPALTLIPVLTPASTLVLTPASSPVLTPAPALTPASTPAPALIPVPTTPAPALTLIPDSLPAPALTPVPTTPAPTTPAPTTPVPTTPAPSPIPKTQTNYIKTPDTTVSGYDILKMSLVTLSECQTECDSRPNCKGFTITSAINSSNSRDYCNLKSNVFWTDDDSTLDLYQRTYKVLSGNEGETANFGCAVEAGLLKVGDSSGYHPLHFDIEGSKMPLKNINYDNLKKRWDRKFTSILPNHSDSLEEGKWTANYTCKKPAEGNYSITYGGRLGGDVLWTSPSATFEECKNKCDNYGDQCQQFEMDFTNTSSSPSHGYSSWDRLAKTKCSLTSSRDKIVDPSYRWTTFIKLKPGETIVCNDYDPKGTIDESEYQRYRYMGDNKMRWYPNKDIGKSWDPNFDKILEASCTGYELGEDMKMKE